ncbi:MAG: hypothetical protein PHV68_02670 [Candidatus Gastranaerophilales bacterium]|nr:hypothetical protein [Candidatus Gastranaerophilales bacterium]
MQIEYLSLMKEKFFFKTPLLEIIQERAINTLCSEMISVNSVTYHKNLKRLDSTVMWDIGIPSKPVKPDDSDVA